MVTALRSRGAPFPCRAPSGPLDRLADRESLARTQGDRRCAVLDPARNAGGAAPDEVAGRIGVLVVQFRVPHLWCADRLRIESAVDEHEPRSGAGDQAVE